MLAIRFGHLGIVQLLLISGKADVPYGFIGLAFIPRIAYSPLYCYWVGKPVAN